MSKDEHDDIVEYDGRQISIQGPPPPRDRMRFLYVDNMYYGSVPAVGAEQAARDLIDREMER